MTETMKAVRMHDIGEPEVLKHESVPLPELNSTDVLVRVCAVGINKQKFEEEVGNVDVVLDLVGGDTWRRSLQVLKPGGHLVSVMMDTALLDESPKHGVNGHLYIVQPSGAELKRIANYIREGKLKARVDRTFSLEDVVQAHTYTESGKAQGKVVLIKE